MVFPSIPAYLDPSNWQQLNNHQTGVSSGNHQLQSVAPDPAVPRPPPQPHGGGGPGSIRPNSMAERARLANLQMPEGPLKCPRCESTNTKFCYFNNYSLSQPRHFCKNCRRYWTKGGALRSVPVGGGCRRKKRSKSTGSKSPASSSDRQTTSSSTSTVSSKSDTAARMLGLTSQLPPLRFMSPLGQVADHYNISGDLGLNYNGISGISASLMGTSEMNFHIGSGLLGGTLGGGGGGGGAACLLSSGGIEQWRQLQQSQQHLPFMNGLDISPGGLYQFQGGVEQPIGFLGETSHQVRPKISTSMLTQLASMKVEENNQEMNLSRQLMGITGNGQWSNNNVAWTDPSSFSSSSTSNPL